MSTTTESTQDLLSYPILLDQAAILRLLPHRGEMQFIREVTVLAHNHYQGKAVWSASSAALQGHFPGVPVVPGVYLVEAVAQVAGAGMFAGDPVARAQPKNRLGVLAAIRGCAFKKPVFPDQVVDVDVRCRQVGAAVAQVKALLKVEGLEVANVEIVVVNAPIEQLAGIEGVV